MDESKASASPDAALTDMERRQQLIAHLQKLEQRNVLLRAKVRKVRNQAVSGSLPVQVALRQKAAAERAAAEAEAAAKAAADPDKEKEEEKQKWQEEEEAQNSSDPMLELLAAGFKLNGQSRINEKHISALLDACLFLSTSNQASRAQLASLLWQQRVSVMHLSVLSEHDKESLMQLVRDRFAEQDEETLDAAQQVDVYGAPSMSSRRTSSSASTINVAYTRKPATNVAPSAASKPCYVDQTILQTEWARVANASSDNVVASRPVPKATSSTMDEAIDARAAAMRAPDSNGAGSLSSLRKSRDESLSEPVPFLVWALSENRSHYMDAMTTSQRSKAGSSDQDAIDNFGFSMTHMPGYEYEFDEGDNEDNLVVVTSKEDGKEQIKCATLNKLMERMTSEGRDLNVRYTFLLTYRSFTTPKEFLEKLEARYYVPIPPNMSRDEIKLFQRTRMAPIQIKVLGILKKWLEEHYTEDFLEDEELRGAFRVALEKMIDHAPGPWAIKSGRSLMKLLESLIAGSYTARNLYSGGDHYPPPLVSPTQTLHGFRLLEVKPLEIARQLSLMDYDLFRQIKSREFLNQSWNKKHKHVTAPHIVQMIERWNRVCYWTQLEILGYKGIDQRMRMLEKFIKIVKRLRTMNNFQSAYAIYIALSSTPIYRLRKTWERLPQRQQERFDDIKQMFSNDKNMKAFRAVLQVATAPCVPYIGIFLADLTFIEDGNPDMMRGMINFHKRRMLAERIMWIKQYQQSGFGFEKVQVLQDYFEKHAIITDEETMYNLSLAMEPREKRAQ